MKTQTIEKTTAQHTPGPWEVLRVNGDPFVAAKPYEGHPYFGRTRTIEVLSDEDYPTKGADARLIAAAPDLLAACQRIAANPDLSNDGWDMETMEDIRALARAIARATGCKS